LFFVPTVFSFLHRHDPAAAQKPQSDGHEPATAYPKESA
jgi:hypothetical protein